MAIIELQDPLGTEIQSATVSGAVDALNVISKSLDLNSELLEKVSMHPASGLDSSDPRRIYEVDNGNRLWLSSPNPPKIYVNDSEISTSSKEFSIDYIGGSITFTGSYRPSESDSVTVSCIHISKELKVYGGSEIKITFSQAFLGQKFTVTGGDNETYSGVVDSSLESVVRVKSVNTTYIVSANSIAGKNFTAEVEIGSYYGQYKVTLSSFNATIKITTRSTSYVTITGPSKTYNATANESGEASVSVIEEGNYSITSTYDGVNSDTIAINIINDGETYTVTNTFITLNVTIKNASSSFGFVYARNGNTTLQGLLFVGIARFILPNTGVWNIYSTIDGKSASTTVNCDDYKNFDAVLDFVSNTLNDNSWETISEVSSSGKAANYWEVGDTKDIVLNGTIAALSLSNFSVSAFIVGINHNSSREGNNLVHFQIGKKSSKLICFCDSEYGEPSYNDGFRMNKSDSYSGGWASCYMRSTVLGNNSTPNSPSSNSFLAALPSDLRSVMKSAKKYTYNSSGVTATTDYLALLSEFEVQGAITYSDPQEQNHQKQYAYYANGNSKVSHKHNSTSSTARWWCRSPAEFPSAAVCYVLYDGSPLTTGTSHSDGCSPVFFV